MNRPLPVLVLAMAALAHGPLALAREPLRVVAGYTARSFQDVYVEDGKRVFRASVERFLARAAPDVQVQLEVFDGPSELAGALRERRVDIAGFTPNQFVDISEKVSLEPAFVTESAAGVYDDAILLVRADAPFGRLTDLRGGRLMILTGAENGHHELWLDTWALRDARQPMRDLFASVGTGRTGSQTILACFFSTAEACLVPRRAFDVARELNPQIDRELRVLGHSSGILGAVIAFRPGVDPRIKSRLAEVIARVHEDSFGKQILTLFRQTRMALFRPEYLLGTEALVRENRRLRSAVRAGDRSR